MIITCSKCGEKINIRDHLFEISPEGALIELLFAQMARMFRREFNIVYATEGEADIEAIRLLLESHKNSEEKIGPTAITEIHDAWGHYLRKNGSAGTVQEFAYSWIPEENGDSSRVIPFRPRP